MSEKLHFGCLDNKVEEIYEDGDAYCVECSDGIVDVAESTFSDVTSIHDACDTIDDDEDSFDENPHSSDYDYWFKGTMKELLIEINKTRED